MSDSNVFMTKFCMETYGNNRAVGVPLDNCQVRRWNLDSYSGGRVWLFRGRAVSFRGRVVSFRGRVGSFRGRVSSFEWACLVVRVGVSDHLGGRVWSFGLACLVIRVGVSGPLSGRVIYLCLYYRCT